MWVSIPVAYQWQLRRIQTEFFKEEHKMGKQSTRIWSVLMVIIMIINMLPVHAIAAEDTNTIAIDVNVNEKVSRALMNF